MRDFFYEAIITTFQSVRHDHIRFRKIDCDIIETHETQNQQYCNVFTFSLLSIKVLIFGFGKLCGSVYYAVLGTFNF